MKTAATAAASTTRVTIRRVRGSTMVSLGAADMISVRLGQPRVRRVIMQSMSEPAMSADETAIPAVTVGTALWAVTLVVMTVTYGVDQPDSGVWWFGVAAIGTLSGVIGLAFLFNRRSRLRSRTS